MTADETAEASAVGARNPHWPTWMIVAVVSVAFASGSLFGYYAFGADAIIWLYLPAGVTLSALLLTPRRQWPWILAGVALAEIVVDMSQDWDLRTASGLALANTAEPLVGALLLRRFVTGEVELLRPRHVFAFLVCCVGLAPVVGGVIGATTFVLAPEAAPQLGRDVPSVLGRRCHRGPHGRRLGARLALPGPGAAGGRLVGGRHPRHDVGDRDRVLLDPSATVLSAHPAAVLDRVQSTAARHAHQWTGDGGGRELVDQRGVRALGRPGPPQPR